MTDCLILSHSGWSDEDSTFNPHDVESVRLLYAIGRVRMAGPDLSWMLIRMLQIPPESKLGDAKYFDETIFLELLGEATGIGFLMFGVTPDKCLLLNCVATAKSSVPYFFEPTLSSSIPIDAGSLPNGWDLLAKAERDTKDMQTDLVWSGAPDFGGEYRGPLTWLAARQIYEANRARDGRGYLTA